MNELHQELDQALRALPVSEAPVERVKRDGRRLRTRRRAGLVAGALAVIAVAAGVPALAASLAGNEVTPTVSRPVPVTDTPPADVTHAAGGLTSSSGVVAQGQVGTTPWHATIGHPGQDGTAELYFCLGTADRNCDPSLALSPSILIGPSGADPVSTVTGSDVNGTYFVLALVARNVPYLVISVTGGEQLKLIPVTTDGHRFVAWAVPKSMSVTRVTAHLGGPYTDDGQTLSTVPFEPAGQPLPNLSLWLKPDQAAPRRAQGVIGSGLNDGQHWRATAYEGPWGTCVVLNAAATYCLPVSRFTTTGVIGWGGPPAPAIGSAAPGVAFVRVGLSNGQSMVTNTLQVGNEKFFALWLEKGVKPVRWTAYDAAMQQVGTGKV